MAHRVAVPLIDLPEHGPSSGGTSDRPSCAWAARVLGGAAARPFEVCDRQGVNQRLHRFDTCSAGIEQLETADFAAAHQLGLTDSAETGERFAEVPLMEAVQTCSHRPCVL